MSDRPTLPQVLARKRREVFLKVLARTGKVAEAARAVGCSDTAQFYRARDNDEEFAAAWDAAVHASADLLIEAAQMRAVDGVHKPVFFKGEIVGTEVNYSDTLLVELLRARRPQEFRRANQAVDANVDVNVRVGVAMLPMTAGNTDEWEAQVKVMQEQQKRLPAFDSVQATPVIDGKATEIPQQESQTVVQDGKRAEPQPGPYNKELGRG